MRTLLLLRGSPGCGKSTWIEQNGLKQYALSADDIRMMCSSPQLDVDGKFSIDQNNDSIVWSTLFKLLEVRMQNGEFTVIDATNSKTSEMNRYKELCTAYKYRIYCVDFTNIPIEVAKERNAGFYNLNHSMIIQEAQRLYYNVVSLNYHSIMYTFSYTCYVIDFSDR